MDPSYALLSNQAIPLDPREGGALDWFDKCDSEHRVILDIFGSKAPKGKQAFERWLIETLRELPHQQFFFYPNTHKGMALSAEVIGECPTGWPEHTHTALRIPLAQIFGLPNQNAALELDQMRDFLTFVDQRGRGLGKDGRDTYLQWYRSGHGNRGIEWAGILDKDEARAATVDLEAWLAKPGMKEWKKGQLDGLSRVRLSPHCWFSMSALVQDRWYLAQMDGMKKKADSVGPGAP